RGLKVTIWQVGNIEKIKPDAENALQTCLQANIPIQQFNEKVDLEHPDVIVDAICGIGLHDNLREDALVAIKKMERSRAPILAIDIPSGIDADTGQSLNAAVHAAATI